jgi:cytochrome c oxidase subunit 4
MSYWLAWAALMALMALMALRPRAHSPLGEWNTVINLAIAALKAALVAWFFMHLRRVAPLTRALAVAAVFMLALLFGLSSTDFATRPDAPARWDPP